MMQTTTAVAVLVWTLSAVSAFARDEAPNPQALSRPPALTAFYAVATVAVRNVSPLSQLR